ncbi:unnamed protein product [Closterium sp. NIES-54]
MLIRWLLATEGTRGRRVSCLHSDRGGEFRSGILRGFCGKQGISQSWTLPESPQQNGVAECRIGLVMDIARTSMIHARAPHFLWPYAVHYAAHQLNLQPRVSRPEASPTSLWTGSPGVGSAFRVLVDSGGVGAGGADTGGARSGVARSQGARAGGASSGGAGTGGASSGGVGAGGAGAGGASSGGAGAGGVGTGGASSGGAGAGGTDTGGATSGDTGTGGASSEETGVGDTTSAVPAQPPHRHDWRLQVARRRARDDCLRALGLPSSSPVRSPSLPAFGPTFPPPDNSLVVWSSPRSPSSPPVVPHYRARPCPPRANPSSPVTDLGIALFCSSRRRSPPVSVLLSPPLSSLPVSPTPISDYNRDACPVVSRFLATLATDSRFSPSFVSALTAAVAEFATTSRLDYATRVVPAPPFRPLSVGGEFALGCDVLEDRQSELKYLAATSPSLCAMLLSPEGDPDVLDIANPRTYREAVSGEWDSQWIAAMDSELASWRSTCTYVDAVPPPRANVVDGMWLFKWHNSLRSTLRDVGFRPSAADPSLFVRAGPTPFFILVYVDDLVFATADRAVLAEVKSELQKRHMCTDLGELQHYLGLQITRDRAARTITPTHLHMVKQVLRRFEFQFSTTRPTPLAVDHRLTGPFPDEPFESSGPYAELVGCLMYLMTCTRPDLAFPLSVLSRFVANGRHRPVHWTAAVRVAKYMATTSGVGLVLGGTEPVELTGHCDSSYADDVEAQHSTQGYCFSLGARAVSWRSTRSSSVATSSAEAKIYAGAMAALELRWLTFLLTDLGERPRSAPTLYADNKAMILLCRETRMESIVKHIDVKYFLLRELQRRGQARLDFVASVANTANIFTKALPPCDHHRFLDVLERQLGGQNGDMRRTIQLPRPSTVPTLFDPAPREYTEEDKERLSRKMVGATVDKAFTTTPFDSSNFRGWALRFRMNACVTNLWEFFVTLQYPVTMANVDIDGNMERLEMLQSDYSLRAALAFWVSLHSGSTTIQL